MGNSQFASRQVLDKLDVETQGGQMFVEGLLKALSKMVVSRR
jgi:hypothetical protein